MEKQFGEQWKEDDARVRAKLTALEERFGRKPNIVYILADDALGIPSWEATAAASPWRADAEPGQAGPAGDALLVLLLRGGVFAFTRCRDDRPALRTWKHSELRVTPELCELVDLCALRAQLIHRRVGHRVAKRDTAEYELVIWHA